MTVHDWSKVDGSLFEDFRRSWIHQIQRAFNEGLLPADHYALIEQFISPQPDFLRPRLSVDDSLATTAIATGGSSLQLAPPRLEPTAEAEPDYSFRKRSCIAVRHVSGDELVAVVEIVSVGNKSSRRATTDFVQKASALLANRIHLLIVDVHK